MKLKFFTKTAMITVNNFDPKNLEVSCHGAILTYFINNKKELIAIHKDAEKVKRVYERVIEASKDPDAKQCFIGRNLERVELIYE